MSHQYHARQRKVHGVIAGRWKLAGKIGENEYGIRYEAKDVINGRMVEVDLEREHYKPLLQNEFGVFKALTDNRGLPRGFAKIHHVGEFVCGEVFRVMVMEKLGNSLYDKLLGTQKSLLHRLHSLSKNDILTLAIEGLYLLERLHLTGFIHNGVKPQNFKYGIEDPDVLYLVEFSSAERFIDAQTGSHIAAVSSKPRRKGEMSFASVNCHLGHQRSRKDDLESLGYVFLYLRNESLPWTLILAPDQETRNDAVLGCKQNDCMKSICRNMPHSFADYFTYVRNLGFDENPDYALMRNLFRANLQDRRALGGQTFE